MKHFNKQEAQKNARQYHHAFLNKTTKKAAEMTVFFIIPNKLRKSKWMSWCDDENCNEIRLTLIAVLKNTTRRRSEIN